MKASNFEQELHRRPLRPVPGEWRAQILQAARQAGASSASWRHSLLGPTSGSWWRQWLWPCPEAWAGLAAAWVVILIVGTNLPGATSAGIKASAGLSPNPAITWMEQRRELSQMLGAMSSPIPVTSPSSVRPRSEGRPVVAMA